MVGRQGRAARVDGQMDGAGIAGCRVAELVLGRDRVAVADAGHVGGRAVNDQNRRGRGADGDRVRDARVLGIAGVRDRDRLRAKADGPEDHAAAEQMDAVIESQARECVVGGQVGS